MGVNVLQHAVFSDILSMLRDKRTGSEKYRSLARRAGIILAVHATKGLQLKQVTIETPLQACQQGQLAHESVIIPVLRAGLSLVEPFEDLLPGASIGHIGLKRDETTGAASEYACSLPVLKDKDLFILDPMLATGGSACAVLKHVTGQGAHSIMYASIVAAPEGVQRVQKEFPDVELCLGVVDEKLNSKFYIVPGLGDFGDRLYGTLIE